MPATLEAPPAAPAAPATPLAPATPPPGSPAARPSVDRAQLSTKLREKVQPERGIDPRDPAQQQPEAPKTPDPNAPAEKPKVETKPESAADPDAPPEDKRPVDPADPDNKKKLSPWRLLDHEKQARLKAESELQELRKGVVPEAERTAITERLTAAEKRRAELEEEITYVNYSKSQEFQDKYQKPYEDAWKRAMGELGQLTITDPGTQQARNVTAADFQQVLNMPLGEARKFANEVYGDFADDVMLYRAEVMKLWQTQESALRDARENGSKRETDRQQKFQAAQREIAQDIQRTWKAANEAARTNPEFGHFFTPKEGDDEGNKLLESGYGFVDKAMSESPAQPGIDSKERARRVKQQAAIRNRAAAEPRTRKWLAKAENEIKRLQGELDKFKSSTPPAGGGAIAAPASVQSENGMARLHSGLRALAK